ncbi:hypothetical protein PaeBR_18805 [Paenibacillus sp. BR2-3]|uniref:hypothetical protein n=1 Tax=Paenibacillus sp. BR2-3 TaxID=3048494 RepID=UPI0039777693
METFFQYKAMWAELEPSDVIDEVSVRLGAEMVKPGDRISRIGKKKRSLFEMKEGHYLRYVGRIGRTLLFKTPELDPTNLYYAFEYVTSDTLLVGGAQGCMDIRVDELVRA